jgi:glucokinase
VTAEDAVAAARAGDEHAQGLIDRLGVYLGVALTGVINTFEPERVAIGGGLSRAADLFLETAVAEMRARALPALAARAQVSPATGGANAGVVGAALLARHELTGA